MISILKFSGVAPRVSPNKLGPEMAQTATNVRLLAGTLAPWKQPLTVVSGLTAGDPSTIYRFGQDLSSDTQYWFRWNADVDVVKGAISGDQTERTFFTHPTLGARQTNNALALTGAGSDYPYASYPLGVPAPTVAPTAAAITGGDPSEPTETRIYCYTYITALGEEGPPSPTSAALDLKPTGAVVQLTGMPASAPLGYEGYITGKRIYRTLSGNLTTEFQLVDEIAISQPIYNDSIASAQLDEVIPTATWQPPPSGVFGITQMANGIMLLFKGYDIFPSEAYIPYAYPVDYQQSVDYPIVGAKAVGSSAIITTTGHPYLLTGSDPSALSLIKLENPQACVSKRSMAPAEGGVIYASPDGLIFVSTSGQVQNMTAQLFSRKEWQALVPSSIDGYFHDGRYFGFYNTGLTQGGFIFDPAQGASAFTFIDTYATAGYSDLIQDALYLKVGTNIVKWDAGATNFTYTWKSAVFELGGPESTSAAQVIAKAYPVTFKLYTDGSLRHTQTVTNSDPFRLPGGNRPRFLELEVSGTNEVLAVHLGNSMAEFRSK